MWVEQRDRRPKNEIEEKTVNEINYTNGGQVVKDMN
jgi:hypothetical protein